MRPIDADALTYELTSEIRLSTGEYKYGLNAARLRVMESPTIRPDEPRVMTLEEVVEHFSLPPEFGDDPDAQEDYYEDIQPLYFEYPDQEARPWAIHWRGFAQSQRYLDERRHTYNRGWRCWTARPTDEQRKAVKWDAAD